MEMDRLGSEVKALVADIVDRSALKSGQLFVLGLSSSEVLGGQIGKASSQ